jgi:hypothetical protein
LAADGDSASNAGLPKIHIVIKSEDFRYICIKVIFVVKYTYKLPLMSPLSRHRHLCMLLIASALIVGGCSGGSGDEETGSGSTLTGSAVDALNYTFFVSGTALVPRPSAPIGIWSTMFLSGQGFIASASAVQGVMAESIFHAKPSEDQLNNMYALLEEFATVLSIDIPDLLNRSDDRANTLNEYREGLGNITLRSEQKAKETEQLIDNLQDERSAQSRVAGDVERSQRDAIEQQDFVTAGELQKQLAEEQAKLTKIESDLDLQESLSNTFEDLLEIAHERIDAIDSNREVLIAGLKVIEVPGVEDLGVLDTGQERSRRRGGSAVLGL